MKTKVPASALAKARKPGMKPNQVHANRKRKDKLARKGRMKFEGGSSHGSPFSVG